MAKKSITIVDRIKPPSPKLAYKPHPAIFKTTLEAQRYFEREKERWIMGHAGLTGRQYFHIMETLMQEGDGGVIHPDYREDDEQIFQFLEEISKEGSDGFWHDGFWFAGRGFGKSSILATEYCYNTRVHPGCTQGMTSADMKRIGQFFNKKLDVAMKGIDERLEAARNKFNNTKDGYERGYLVPSKDKYGRPIFAQTDIYGVETSKTEDSPSNFSGLRGILVGIDEAALHGRLKETRESAVEIMKKNGVRIGPILMTGTVEAGVSQESVKQINLLVEKQKELRLKICFTECYRGKYLRSDGSSDHKRFIREYEKECELLDKLEDKTSLLIYKKNNPMTMADVLSFSMTGALPSEVYAQVSMQKEKLLNNPPKITVGNLISLGDNKVGFRPDPDGTSKDRIGHIKIYELPQEGVEYIASTDPIQAENVASEEGSQLVLLIRKRVTRTIVAMYHERTHLSSVISRNAIMLCDMYNKAKNMIENNAGNVLIGKYKDAKRTDLLAKQPFVYGLAVKSAKDNQIYGVRVTGSTKAKDIRHDLIIDELLENVQGIPFIEILDDVANYMTANSDYIDALGIMCIYEKELERKNKRHQIETQEYIEVKVLVNNNGRNEYRTFKKPVMRQTDY